MNELLQYLDSKGAEYKHATNTEIRIKDCLFCGDTKWHLYCNVQNGLLNCKKCNVLGDKKGFNFNELRKKYNDMPIKLPDNILNLAFQTPYKTLLGSIATQYTSRLLNTPEIANYLIQKRGLSLDILKRYQIGWTGKRISIPYFENRELINFNYRFNPLIEKPEGEAKYKSEAGCRPILFNVDCLKSYPKDGDEPVIITEGAFDALILLDKGFQYVLSVPLGATYFNDIWKHLFENINKIYLVYDTDEVGKKGSIKASTILGEEKCRLVNLGSGVKDITDYFTLGKTKDDFVKLLESSLLVSSGEEGIKSLASYSNKVMDMFKNGSMVGYPTGIHGLDELLGGLKKGHLILLSGLASVGKTSFSQNIAFNLADRFKIETLFFSLEMGPVDVVKRFITLMSGLSSEKMSGEMGEVDLKTASDVFKEFERFPIFLYNGDTKITIDSLRTTIEDSIEKHKIKVVFIDHLHYFSQETTNKSSEIGNIVRGIRKIALDLDIPIILLCHINRAGRSQQKEGLYIPVLSDLKDSSSLEQDASEVIFVCRDSDNEMKREREKAYYKIAKNRDGKVGLIEASFDEDTLSFGAPKNHTDIDFSDSYIEPLADF